MKEYNIIAALLNSRKVWQQTRPYLAEYLTSASIQPILKEIDSYYEVDAHAKKCDREVILARILRGLSNQKHEETFREIFNSIPREVSTENVGQELLEIARNVRGLELVQALLNKDDKRQRILLTEYQDLLEREELIDEAGSTYRVHQGVPTEQLISSTEGVYRLPVAPTKLHKVLGNGLVAGDSVLVFARPEVGKTAFGINIARGMASNGHRVLYCSNEGSITRLLLRAKACFADAEVGDVASSPLDVEARADAAGFERCIFVEMYPGNLRQIRELVEEYRPALLIIDQIINLDGSKDENYTLHLGKLARGIRNIGIKYGVVTVSFAQAADSATNKLVLDMGDVNWSNTDLQAAADVMIGIGADEEFLQNNWRMISLPKNKTGGSHDAFRVRIDPLKSRYYSE